MATRLQAKLEMDAKCGKPLEKEVTRVKQISATFRHISLSFKSSAMFSNTGRVTE
jgi:hypothetical protein